MADYLLDTNILSYWYNTACGEHLRVLGRVDVAKQPDPRTGYVSRLLISAITLGEIEFGHCVAHKPDAAKQAAYTRFVREQCPVALEITDHVAQQYGELRAWLFNNCAPTKKRSRSRRAEELVDPTTGKELGIQENDIWIAAQAKTYNLVLVTHDKRGNFGKMLKQFEATLLVEDWAS